MIKRIPAPYERDGTDTPVCLARFSRGSNNRTRATLRVFEYPDGDVCVQLEDKLGGAELWCSQEGFGALIAALQQAYDEIGAAKDDGVSDGSIS